MTHSVDLRKKVLEMQAKNNWNAKKTEEHFDILPMSVVRWNKKLELKATRERPKTKINLEH